MKRSIAMGVIVLFWFAVGVNALPPPQEASYMANGNNKRWAYRHNKDDKNSRSNSFATVVYLHDAGTVTDPMTMEVYDTVAGDLYFWTGYDMTAKAYTVPHHYSLTQAKVKRAGQKNRMHESCTFTNSATVPAGGPVIPSIYVSLFKGKDKGKSSGDKRLVVRFKFPPDGIKGTFDDCCDLEPDDDVLQEEDDGCVPGDPPLPDDC